MIWRRRNVAGRLIGGIAETPEMRDFCAGHGITSDIEMIPVDQIEADDSRMLKSGVTYRFVIDTPPLPRAARSSAPCRPDPPA